MLQQFGVEVAEHLKREIHKREIKLLISHKAKDNALGVLRKHLGWQQDYHSTTDAIVELESAIENWLQSDAD